MAIYSSGVENNTNFSIDYHRCGKCSSEYDSLEDFIHHKISVERCSLVLWESKKLNGIGLKIPSFIDNGDCKKKRLVGDVHIAAGNTIGESSPNKVIVKKRRGRPRKNENLIANAMENSAGSSSGRWKCCFCKLTFSSFTSLKCHKDNEHKYDNSSSNPLKGHCEIGMKLSTRSSTPDNSSTKLIITENGYVGQTGTVEFSKECTCPKCGNKYKDSIVLKTHLKTVHCDIRPFKCKYDCSLSFKTKGSLMRHMRRHTGERPFKCRQCNRSFRESGALTRHLKSRFPCSTKSDNDLARYGKTVEVNECVSAKASAECLLPRSISTLKIIITDISNKSKGSFPDEEVSCSPQIGCGLIMNELVQKESSNGNRQNSEATPENNHQHQKVCSAFEKTKDALVEFDASSSEANVNIPSPKISSICNSESRECVLGVLQEPSNSLFHELLNENEDLKCLSCMQHFVSKVDLKTHLMIHVEKLPFRCIHCCFVCQSKQQLVKHKRRRHGVLADDTMKSCEDLVHATLELEEEDSHIQDVVKQLFRTQNSIEAEELEFSGLIKKPAKHSCRCHICLKRFSCSLYLGCHMGIHTGEKPFSCGICKKRFFLKDSLKKHSVCHSEERRYRCGECYKSFKRLSHVRDHLRIHSLSCPYQCGKCGKAFRWQGTLKSHELSHGGPALRVHHCVTCGRRFPSKWSLVRHQRLHSTETSSSAQSHSHKEGVTKGLEKTLDCASDNKVVNLKEDTLIDHKQEGITFEEQVTSISVTSAGLTAPGQTYVLITQEDGSSCLVPTVAIVEEFQEDTSAANNAEGSYS